MRYQDRIYNQNGNNVRNHTIALPNTSSDICTFDIPLFTMTSGGKIDCIELTCDLSGVSYNNVLTATTDCFISNGLDGGCFNNVKWNTNIYEDGDLVYTNTFYTSSNINDAANQNSFTNSVTSAFDLLGYDYSINGTQYTLSQDGFKDFKLSIETEINYDNNCLVTGSTTGDTFCSCPTGYDLTPEGDACQSITITAATFNGSGSTIAAGDTNFVFGQLGAYFYEDITNIVDLPIIRASNVPTLETQSGGTINWTNKSFSGNTFWNSLSNPANGRLNNSSISASTTEWVGFSECIDILTDGTYYIAMGADNFCRFSVDGELIIELYPVDHDKNFKIWHVFPYHLTSGKHIVEMEGLDDGGVSGAFGAEIYFPTDLATLTGATTTGDTGLIFSTASKVGDYYDIGTSIGYSCPSGYALDLCDPSPQCSKITTTGTTCIFTGTCSGDTEMVCNLNFNGLTSGDTNVHIITGQTTIPLDFTFTANTHSFTGGTVFKYDIYKYDKTVSYFFNNPIYTSEEFYWENFSGTSAFTASLPVNSIDIDGDYLVKGYYIYDACTEFANLSGDKKISPKYKKGVEYSMYQPYKDFHFVSFTKADTPILGSVENDDRPIGALLVNSEILDGTTNEFNIPYSTGAYIISLNGITLSQGLDYNVIIYSSTGGTTQPSILKLSGDTEDGDILTYALTNNENNNGLIFDGHEIESPIISGTTGNQGDETVYYNTTTGRYEFYTTYNPSTNNDVVVTLNGVTLANNIDYYLSTSVPNRIIFEGELVVGDIINVFYNSNGSLVGNVFTTSFNVAWSISTPPQTTSGVFTIEVSDDINFSNILYTNDVDYVVNQIGYSSIVPLTGSVGSVRYYRVKNKKSYVDMCGNPIITIAYSEVNEITIQTNAYNSY